MTPAKPRSLCPNGCGRRSNTGGVCAECRAGRAPLMPAVHILPVPYLLACVEELARRRTEIDAALTKARGNA